MNQETIEEAAERYTKEEFFSDQETEIKIGKSAFIHGAKWMQERMSNKGGEQ